MQGAKCSLAGSKRTGTSREAPSLLLQKNSSSDEEESMGLTDYVGYLSSQGVSTRNQLKKARLAEIDAPEDKDIDQV